jgi:hypothetical protein
MLDARAATPKKPCRISSARSRGKAQGRSSSDPGPCQILLLLVALALVVSIWVLSSLTTTMGMDRPSKPQQRQKGAMAATSPSMKPAAVFEQSISLKIRSYFDAGEAHSKTCLTNHLRCMHTFRNKRQRLSRIERCRRFAILYTI